MKKILLCASLLGLAPLSIAATSSIINYAPLTIPHGQEVVFDLEKGSPAGMRPNIYYKLTCSVTTNDKTGIALNSATVTMANLLVDGQAYSSRQFEIQPNSVLEMNKVYIIPVMTIPDLPFGRMNLINLDNTNDVQLSCSAVPDYS